MTMDSSPETRKWPSIFLVQKKKKKKPGKPEICIQCKYPLKEKEIETFLEERKLTEIVTRRPTLKTWLRKGTLRQESTMTGKWGQLELNNDKQNLKKRKES